MARSRKSNTVPRHPDADQGLNANSVVSYRIRSARERKGYTQQEFAQELGKLTGHVLPQSSIGAMERWEGDKQRMFDAHELYLLSLVLDVPIAYFFIPPPGMNTELMRDSRYEVNALPLRLIGTDDQVAAFDEAIGELTGSSEKLLRQRCLRRSTLRPGSSAKLSPSNESPRGYSSRLASV